MQQVVESDPAFAEMDRETAHVAGVLIGAEEFMEKRIMEEGDNVNMCTALKEWSLEERAIGRAEGREEGCAAGMALLNALNLKLLQDNRVEDLCRASADEKFQKQLLEEYQLQSNFSQ